VQTEGFVSDAVQEPEAMTMKDVEGVAPPSNHAGRLILAPRDAEVCPDRDRLLRTLLEAGFIADPIAGRESAFIVGPEFPALLAFVGCAVAIACDPQAGSPYCHVLVPPASAHPRWWHGRNTRAPRCPDCRARLIDRPAHMEPLSGLSGSGRPDSAVACPSCGESRPIWSWDWKQQGGFARLLIQVEEIFPGEAVPTQGFLDLLARASGCPWRYFYVQD
jgi:hypothetical protein